MSKVYFTAVIFAMFLFRNAMVSSAKNAILCINNIPQKHERNDRYDDFRSTAVYLAQLHPE